MNINPPIRNKKTDTWSKKQIAQLEKLYPTTGNEVIAAKIGKTIRAVRSKAMVLKLKKEARYWALKDEKFLLKNWAVLSPEELAEKLSKTKWAVINKYRELKGLRAGHKKLPL